MLRPPLSPLLCLLGLACQSLTGAAQPFAVQVIDESSHRGVPMVTLSTDNHIQLTTDSAGWVLMDEPGLMARAVHFIVSSPGYALPKDADGREGITLTLTPGQSTEIKLVRTAIAERMYRITGQGIYRESSLLGKEAPLPFPNINGDVLSLGRAQVASYQGRLVWAWPDTRLLAARNGPVVSGAAVDLPGAGGLDPTQGVHLRYFTNEQEETLPLLAVPKGQHAAIDGLMSVKDAIGAEHLLVHYAFLTADGTCAEHGIAEFNDRHAFDRKVVLGDEYTWQHPKGHAVEASDGDGTCIYFSEPCCHVRVAARYEAALSPTSYEALAWSEDARKMVWQQERGPVTQREETKLLDRKEMKGKDARCHLTQAGSGELVELTEGSVQHNALRNNWIMIGSSTASPGEVWYSEAETITGPWTKAVPLTGLGLGGIAQLPALEQDNGRYIYFEGTLEGSGTVPRYQDNQLMYRLDLKDPRLVPAHNH
jgi:hypothetical protein